MRKLKPIYFKIPAIGNEHYIYVCVDTKKNGLKKVKSYFKDYTDTEFTLEDFEVRGKTFDNPKLFPFMWVDIECKELPATVAHEAFHCISSIFRYNDIEITKATEEIFAIILGSITRAVIQELSP